MAHILIFTIFLLNFQVILMQCCTSFYCINSCGDYKLILANNRDEDIFRLTKDADLWPKNESTNSNVYGALDLKNGGKLIHLKFRFFKSNPFLRFIFQFLLFIIAHG